MTHSTDNAYHISVSPVVTCCMVGTWSSIPTWSIIALLRPCEAEQYVIPPEAEVGVKIAISLNKKDTQIVKFSNTEISDSKETELNCQTSYDPSGPLGQGLSLVLVASSD